MTKTETVWEKIYQDYQRDGCAWATLKDELHPIYISFLACQSFPIKKALDIGCGNGKYLHHLESVGFEITGIDSSQTAIEMAKKILKSNAILIEHDMYDYNLGVELYDLVVSHATLHHGQKNRVLSILVRIYDTLIHGGKFFMTLPSDNSQKNWAMMKEHERLEDGTCIPLNGPEKGLPHSFFSENEINNCFKVYSRYEKQMDEKDGRWIITGQK